MKIRSDSPFATLTEDQCLKLLEISKSMTIEELCKVVEGAPEPIRCSLAAMKKFIRRLEREERLEMMEDDAELVEMMSKRGANSAVREATLATMRQRMFEATFESNNREVLMETFTALSAEKERERAAELEERRVKVMEENAKIGWRKLERQDARAGLKALPRVRELLTNETKTERERIVGALQILSQVEAGLVPTATASEATLAVPNEPRALPAPGRDAGDES